MEEVDLRDDLQNKGLNSWIKNKCIGTVVMPTGTGKSRVAIKAILEINRLRILNNPTGSTRILHLAERENRREGFKEQITKYIEDTNAFYNDISIDYACYQGYKGLEGRSYHLIICDEIHDSITPTYSSIFTQIKRKALLGLTATIPNVKYETEEFLTISKYRLLQSYCPVVFKHTLATSIANKTSRVNDIYFIECELTDMEKASYTAISNKISRNQGTLAAKFLGSKRTTLIATCTDKIQKSKEIIRYLEEFKIKSIYFTTEVSVLDDVLYDRSIIGSRKKPNAIILNKFNTGQIHVIGSYKMLKQGENLDGLDVCIITSSSKNNIALDTTQRVGRLRLNSSKNGIVIVLFVKDTYEQSLVTTIPLVLNTTYSIITLNNLYDKLSDFISAEKP